MILVEAAKAAASSQTVKVLILVFVDDTRGELLLQFAKHRIKTS